MKIVILNGSARKGNTYTCVKAFAEGAAVGCEVEILNCDELNVSPCKGCGACECTKGCIATDDSNAVVDKVLSADLIVFASPIYWWGVTAQLKTVIDKLYCKANLLKGKRIGVIMPAGSSTDDEEFSLIKRQFELISEYMSWTMEFFKPFEAYGKDDMAENGAALEELKALGASYCGRS